LLFFCGFISSSRRERDHSGTHRRRLAWRYFLDQECRLKFHVLATIDAPTTGGHTTEALTLLSSLDFARYTPRTYIISDGDTLSAQKARSLEATTAIDNTTQSSQYSILYIPRARRVHQPLWSTPPTLLKSLLACIKYITLTSLRMGDPEICPQILLLNGPGTCFVLCAAVYFNRFLGLPSPRVIYVESFARAQTVSLSGRLLRPIVDLFVVQWPNLLNEGARGEYRGWLV